MITIHYRRYGTVAVVRSASDEEDGGFGGTTGGGGGSPGSSGRMKPTLQRLRKISSVKNEGVYFRAPIY